MRIIKVNATDSTNNFAREYLRENKDAEAFCVVAKNQTKGRGQRGSGWSAEPGQNLTFSVYWPKIGLAAGSQFLVSAMVSVAVIEALSVFQVPKLKVKWPNDIMAGNFKIGGILIENILKNNAVEVSIIGVGLNVNQTRFENLPQAASMKLVTGNNFELNEVLDKILQSLEEKLKNLLMENQIQNFNLFSENMFRKDIVSTFQLPEGSFFTGIIRGITAEGKLKVELENSVFKTFDLKEVKLMY